MNGHFSDEDDDYWQLYINMKIIIERVISTILPINISDLLASSIEEYLCLQQKLFPDVNSTLKHHFLVRYPRIRKNVGPLWNVCGMRGEAKHREGTIAAHSAIRRINVCHTIALRQQLKLNYRFLNKTNL